MESAPKSARMPFKPGGYRNLKRILSHNYDYIANLMALRQWYRHIRRVFIGPDFPRELADGLDVTLEKGIAERIKQLGHLRDRLIGECPKDGGIEQMFCQQWPDIQKRLEGLGMYEGAVDSRDRFRTWIGQAAEANRLDYIKAIQSLGADRAEVGSQWLQGIVDHVTGL
jgi:hypothetical protein